MDAKFVNGPLDGKLVDIGPSAMSVIDVCDPVMGEPVLWKMVVPNNGIWQYHQTLEPVFETTYEFDAETQEYVERTTQTGFEFIYIGTEYDLTVRGQLIVGWQQAGNYAVYYEGAEPLEWSIEGDVLVFGDFKVRHIND